MAWAVWLLVPVAATVLAALWSWWRSRPKRAPSTDEAMRAHADFLDALVIPAATLPGCPTPPRRSSGSPEDGPSPH